MQHDCSNKLNLDPRVGGRVVCGQKVCYHVSTFRDSNKFDLQHDHVLKKLNFYLFIASPGWALG